VIRVIVESDESFESVLERFKNQQHAARQRATRRERTSD